MPRRDTFVAPVLESALILVVAVTAWATQAPFVFTSLGPTAFEMIETPERKSARPYSIVIGHLIGVLAGFAALWVTHAFVARPTSSNGIPLPRVWAAALAALLTVFGTMLARARQPAALSTTLLIALGSLQTARDGVIIMGAVLLMTLIGEPIRRLRAEFRRKQVLENAGQVSSVE